MPEIEKTNHFFCDSISFIKSVTVSFGIFIPSKCSTAFAYSLATQAVRQNTLDKTNKVQEIIVLILF